MSVRATLEAGRARIEFGWTQGTRARNVHEVPVIPESPDAVCWCASGAIDGLDAAIHHHKIGALIALERTLGKYSLLTGYNDDPRRTKKDVLNLFDKAITAARLG